MGLRADSEDSKNGRPIPWALYFALVEKSTQIQSAIRRNAQSHTVSEVT